MIKLAITNEMIQAAKEIETIKKHEARAKKHLINNRIKELIADGVEKELAEVMARVEYEIEF